MQISHSADVISFECILMLKCDTNVEWDWLDKHKSLFPAHYKSYMIAKIKLTANLSNNDTF